VALPECDLLAFHRDGRLGAADSDRRLALGSRAKVAERDLERRGRGIVPNEQVRGPVRQVVHRSGREEALRLHPAPARVILDGRLDARLEDRQRPAHGTGVAAAASSRRRLRSSASSATVAVHSRNAPTSNVASSTRYRYVSAWTASNCCRSSSSVTRWNLTRSPARSSSGFSRKASLRARTS